MPEQNHHGLAEFLAAYGFERRGETPRLLWGLYASPNREPETGNRERYFLNRYCLLKQTGLE
jgi:hypothetical protein